MIKNQWDAIQDGTLHQSTELNGMDVEVTFGADQDGEGELRIWPYVPKGAPFVPMPEDLESLIGKRARVGNEYGREINQCNILIDSCVIESLYSKFDKQDTQDILSSARIDEPEQEGQDGP